MTVPEKRASGDLPDSGRVAFGNPSQESAVKRIAHDHGIDYLVTDLAPRGTAYIIDLDKVFEPAPAPVWSEPVLRGDRLTFRMQMAQPFRLRTRVEQDPFWHRPKDAGWRWVLNVIGYDWRKLRGRLRQIPRSFGVITGLSA